MTRVTDKQINERFARVCNLMGWSQDVIAEQSDGKTETKWRVGAVVLDNNPSFGGREVTRVTSEGGGTSPITSRRMNAQEFIAWCEGICVAHWARNTVNG
jgi:hypothetical protein